MYKEKVKVVQWAGQVHTRIAVDDGFLRGSCALFLAGNLIENFSIRWPSV